MVAQVAAAGFFFNIFVESVKDPNLSKSGWVVCSLIALASTGIVLNWYFYKLTQIGFWWLDRWNGILRELEAQAFGDLYVLRNASPPATGRVYFRQYVGVTCTMWVILILLVIIRALS